MTGYLAGTRRLQERRADQAHVVAQFRGNDDSLAVGGNEGFAGDKLGCPCDPVGVGDGHASAHHDAFGVEDVGHVDAHARNRGGCGVERPDRVRVARGGALVHVLAGERAAASKALGEGRGRLRRER